MRYLSKKLINIKIFYPKNKYQSDTCFLIFVSVNFYTLYNRGEINNRVHLLYIFNLIVRSDNFMSDKGKVVETNLISQVHVRFLN